MPEGTIRPGVEPPLLRDGVAADDVAAIERIVRSTGAFRDDEIAVATELAVEALARGAEASGYHFLFADAGGVPVGYACYGPIGCSVHAWDLYWIAVEQGCRGGGVGRRLLAAVEQRVRARKGRRLYAETSSTAGYAATRAFYERCGYVAEARLEEFYAPGDSKLFFVKVLAGVSQAST